MKKRNLIKIGLLASIATAIGVESDSISTESVENYLRSLGLKSSQDHSGVKACIFQFQNNGSGLGVFKEEFSKWSAPGKPQMRSGLINVFANRFSVEILYGMVSVSFFFINRLELRPFYHNDKTLYSHSTTEEQIDLLYKFEGIDRVQCESNLKKNNSNNNQKSMYDWLKSGKDVKIVVKKSKKTD